MQKSKRYRNTKFSSRLVLRALDSCRANSAEKEKREHGADLSTRIADEKWQFDNLGEFVTSYANDNVDDARVDFFWDGTGSRFILDYLRNQTNISVQAASRAFIEGVFSIFDGASAEDKTTIVEDATKSEITIFIGHGGMDKAQGAPAR
jgi:hypothetical protein